MTLGKLWSFLGYKTITIILHLLYLAFVNEAHVMPQWAAASFYPVNGLPGARPIVLHGDSLGKKAVEGQVPAVADTE